MHLKGDSGFCVKKRDRKKARMDAKRAGKNGIFQRRDDGSRN